jgi:magnesium chelatase accessory protein
MSRLRWESDGRGWPHRAHSSFVTVGGMRWHVQRMGTGPVLLLLHGTGASTHSWRRCLPLLWDSFSIVAPDLPGHAFSTLPPRGQLPLPEMAAHIGALLRELNVQPALAVGHSAGAAIAIRMALDGHIAPAAIVSFNGALLPFPGVAAVAFPALAKILFLNPFAASIAVRLAERPAAVADLIADTGSDLDAESLAFYQLLFRNRPHVEATLGMMAKWDLTTLKAALPRLRVPLTLVTGDRDLAVPPRVAAGVKQILPTAEIVSLRGEGHLAHETAPERACDLIRTIALHHQVLPA